MNEDLKRWDEEAEDWSRDSDHKRRLAKVLVSDALNAFAADIQGKTILDAGCGEGAYTEIIRTLGGKVTGLDGSPKMIEIAKSRRPQIPFVVGDLLENLPFHDKSFDTVTTINVLMSLGSIEKFLSECYRLLQDNGSLILGVFHPALNVPTTRLYRSWWRKLLGRPVIGVVYSYFIKTNLRKDDMAKNPWPFYHRTLEEYSDSFSQNGFTIDRILEPHTLPEEFLQQNPKYKYATRIPRFIFFKLIKHS